MKTILITGGNKGIGFETARQLAKLRHQVIIGSRDVKRGEEALDILRKEDLSAHVVKLDVTAELDIQSAHDSIKDKFGSLDVLINNAAILFKQDQSLLKDESRIFEETIRTNARAPLQITRALLPLLHEGSRVIMVSSGGGSMTDAVGGWSPAYCVSKTLLNSITRQLALELSSKRIDVNAMCPGWVRTDMGGRSAPRSVEQGADTAVWLSTSAKISSGKFFRDRKEIPW